MGVVQFVRRSPLEVGAAVLAAIAVLMAGWAVVATLAAGPFAHADASSATVADGAKVVADTTAASGKAVQFAAQTTTPPPQTGSKDLSDSAKKDIAMQLVSSAENSSLDWKAQYKYIEDIGDGRGYTGGIIGFTSGTHDMLELVQYYNKIAPNNVLTKYIPALQKVDGTDSHDGLGTAFENDWVKAAADPKFVQAQNDERDRTYFNPAVAQGKADGLRALGQFIYYDALVMHGPGSDSVSFGGIRATALKKAKTPAQGGDEKTYLNAFLDARKAAMLTEEAHSETDRVDTMQRPFLTANNFDLNPPLSWSMYGEGFSIK
jgi:chitosanase